MEEIQEESCSMVDSAPQQPQEKHRAGKDRMERCAGQGSGMEEKRKGDCIGEDDDIFCNFHLHNHG